MAKTYRTTDLSRWGPGKGSNLTGEEFDTNTWELEQEIEGIKASPAQANGIANIQVSGAAMLITLQDGTVLGPFQMPVLMWNFRGNWLPLAFYAVLDTFVVPGIGLFVTRQSGASPSTFSPTYIDPTSGLPAYQMIMGFGQLGIAGNNGDRMRYDSSVPAWVNVREKHTIGFNFNGVMADSQDILHYPLPVGVTFNPNFADYLNYSCLANSVAGAASDTTINVDLAPPTTVNTFTTIGTIIMPAGGGPGQFATVGGLVQVGAKGSIVRIQGPAAHDTGLAGLYGVLVGFET